MGITLLAIRTLLAQATDPGEPASAPSVPSHPLQAVYLVLAVTILLFLLLFIVIGLNVARRIARRRETLQRLHEPVRRSAGAESAWAAAGKRAKPFDEPSGGAGKVRPSIPADLDESDLDETDLGETDLGEADLDEDDEDDDAPFLGR